MYLIVSAACRSEDIKISSISRESFFVKYLSSELHVSHKFWNTGLFMINKIFSTLFEQIWSKNSKLSKTKYGNYTNSNMLRFTFPFWIVNTIFGQIWSEKSKMSV